MSNIEEKFFETFEIKAKTNQVYGIQLDYHVNSYPEITDHILLALVCVAMEYRDYPTTINMRNIKERTLRLLIGTKKYLKDTYSSESYHNRLVRKVQAIFKK